MSGNSWLESSSLNKLFGWQVAKKVRHLSSSAEISSFAQEGNSASGMIRTSGKKPQRCSFKLLSPSLLEGQCSCPVYRFEASLCEHIGLLYWHACGNTLTEEGDRLSGENDSGKVSLEEGVAYEFELPANWLALAEKPVLPVRCVLREGEASESDRAIARWLTSRNASPGKPPGIIALDRDLRGGFLSALSGHSHIVCGKERVNVESAAPLINLVLRPEGARWKAIPHIPGSYRVWGDYHWDEASSTLFPRPQAQAPAGWENADWEALLEGREAVLDAEKIILGLSRLQEVFEIEDGEQCDFLKVEEPVPVFRFRWDGALRRVIAAIFADYGEGRGDFPLIPFLEKDSSIHKQAGKKGSYWRRNAGAEKMLLARLEENGFVFSPQGWRLSGEEEVEEFLVSIYPEWKRRVSYVHEESEDFLSLFLSKERLTPRLIPRGEGEGWLEAEFVFTDSAGVHYPATEIIKLIRSGKRKATLRQGKTAYLDRKAAEDWSRLFSESGVQQTKADEYRIPRRAVSSFELLAGESLSHGKNRFPWETVWGKAGSSSQLTLRPYQEQGVRWMWERLMEGGGALLGDDMGLGKTLQTLVLYQVLKESHPEWEGRPSLLVVPASLLANWEEEIRKAFPQMEATVLYGNGREEKEIKDLGITTYALLTRDFARHKRANYAFLAFDEASLVRNPDTDAADSLRRISADYKLALTGTPIENGVRDLWSVFEIVLPGYLGGRKEFQSLYEHPIAASPPDKDAIRRLRHRVEPWILRRTKAEVAPELPPKIQSVRWCELAPEHKTLYHALLREGDALLKDTERKQGKEAARMVMLTTLLRLRQLCDDSRLLALKGRKETKSGKVEVFREMVEELLGNGHKALVFSQFSSMLHLLKKELEQMGIESLLLDGSVRDRKSLIERFRAEDGPSVFLISLKAGGYGLNLQAADTVIHFDPWWNPAVEAQATDRAYRIGQTRPVNVYKMICRGTLEEKILALQERKKGLLGSTFGEDGSGLNALSDEELKGLLN